MTPLRRREFRLYFAGNTFSNMGNWIGNVALAVYMKELTGSSFWVGVVGFGFFVPVIVFALPAGVLADRHDRLRILRRSQVVAGVLATALTVIVATGTANRYAVAAIALGSGVTIAVSIPAMQALLALMVPPEELGDAIRLNAVTFNLARALGPLIAAVALVVAGPEWVFGFNALSFFVLAAVLAVIGRPPFPRDADRPPGPVREGIAYAWRHLRTRWMLLAIVAIGVTLDPIITLSPALAQRFGEEASRAGWIVACWGGGAVTTLVAGRKLLRAMSEHGLGWIGLVALAAGVGGLGAATGMGTALPAAALAGAGYISATMAFTTSIQRDVPESLRGRVMALWTLAFLGPRAAAALVGGAMADAIGARAATASFALVALATVPFLRRVEGEKGEPVPPPA